MAKVHFFYSTMNAGKSTALLQSNHNYQETGMHTILLIPKEDVSKNSGSIKSRIGLKAPAVVLDKNMNLFNFVKDKDAVQKIDAVLIDEVQFLNKKQVVFSNRYKLFNQSKKLPGPAWSGRAWCRLPGPVPDPQPGQAIFRKYF